MRVAERVEQRLVHQRVREPLDHRSRREVVRRERRHEAHRGVGDRLGARVVREVLHLVRVHQLAELPPGGRHVLDAHVAAELAVVGAGRDLLGLAHRPPGVVVHPADRHGHEGRQHVAHVVVADVVHRVHLVDAAYGPPPLGVAQPVPKHLVEQQPGVVVALLHPLGELAGLVQQPADRRHRVRPEQREAERLVGVPGQLVQSDDAVDLVEVLDRVERRDAALPELPVHTVTVSLSGSRVHPWLATGRRPRVVAADPLQRDCCHRTGSVVRAMRRLWMTRLRAPPRGRR